MQYILYLRTGTFLKIVSYMQCGFSVVYYSFFINAQLFYVCRRYSKGRMQFLPSSFAVPI
jgi:hypothetical protein